MKVPGIILCIDISSVSSAGEGRLIGFGIGQSLAELNAMTSAAPATYPSDVYIGYDDIGTTRGIAVFHNGTLVESIDASAAMIAGGQVTIPVSADLGLGNSYYVTIEAGAFTDPSGNPFAGIADSTVWTFTTRISGLADGTYTIWVFFWDQVTCVNQNWGISAGLTSGLAAVRLTLTGSPANFVRTQTTP